MSSTNIPTIEQPATRRKTSGHTVSLKLLFQVVTCCCVFFAVLRVSPAAALVFIIIFAPVLIRVAYVAEAARQAQRPLSRRRTMIVFWQALAAVLLTIGAGVLAFLITVILFGILGAMFGVAVASMENLYEAGIIGTVGGMVWGMAGAFLAMVFTIFRFWGRPAV